MGIKLNLITMASHNLRAPIWIVCACGWTQKGPSHHHHSNVISDSGAPGQQESAVSWNKKELRGNLTMGVNSEDRCSRYSGKHTCSRHSMYSWSPECHLLVKNENIWYCLLMETILFGCQSKLQNPPWQSANKWGYSKTHHDNIKSMQVGGFTTTYQWFHIR